MTKQPDKYKKMKNNGRGSPTSFAWARTGEFTLTSFLWLGSHPPLLSVWWGITHFVLRPGKRRAWGPATPWPLTLSLPCPQAALQVGGHGERLTQCREVLLTTSKAIPVQVDGEPCKLAASRIRIALRNQATMVQKAKRRSAAPLHSECVPPTPPTCPGPQRLCPSPASVSPGAAGAGGTWCDTWRELAARAGPLPSAVWSPCLQPAAGAGAAASPGEQGQHA